MKRGVAVGFVALLLSGCNEPTQQQQEGQGTQAPQSAPVDQDPTPDTGSGGEMQGSSPSGDEPVN
ncbi:hypothetical protein ABFT80_14625 [Mesorhizobium sp. SB112]|uniref:hypothetical protein n=1 Tax=Mesorhizobium sp. SB112 TaxID=3151853 RepID=UPI0032635242